MAGFRAVLDTCVLVPIVKADLLLTLAAHQVFLPLWSEVIMDELARTIVIANPAVTPARAAQRIADMNAAFEDALVLRLQALEDCILNLADPNDRHVVAAAIRGNAAAIVTDNVKDFPAEALEPWGLHAISSDDFLLDLLDLNDSAVLGCLIEMSSKRTNPSVSVTDIVDALERAGTVRFAHEVRSILDCS